MVTSCKSGWMRQLNALILIFGMQIRLRRWLKRSRGGVMSIIPKSFIDKIKNEKPHKWMQVNQTIIVSTHPYVLYQLPNGTEVYGSSEKYLIVEPNDKSWTVNFFNPQTKEFEHLTSEEKDWVFCSSD